ncbi:MAG: cache domain-containing protein [Pseudomonadota bacterium]
MNRRTLLAATGLMFGMLWQGGAGAAENHGSKDEAVAMVKQAVDYLKKNGRDKAFAAFSDPKGQFVDRDLYVSVFSMDGVSLAHGANKKIIGKNMMEYRDPDGKYPIKMGLEIAKTKGSGWYEFKFLNPVSKEMQDKAVYVERYEDIALWVGAYKN